MNQRSEIETEVASANVHSICELIECGTLISQKVRIVELPNSQFAVVKEWMVITSQGSLIFRDDELRALLGSGLFDSKK